VKLIYEGPIDEVEVPDAGVVARRGEPVEIDDDLARLLLKQDTWAEAPAEKPAGKKGAEG
jgi:hypothetical protein